MQSCLKVVALKAGSERFSVEHKKIFSVRYETDRLLDFKMIFYVSSEPKNVSQNLE